MIFDITTSEKAVESIIHLLHIKKSALLDYLDHHTYDFDVQEFIDYFYIDLNSIDLNDISLIAFHLTSSNNGCEDYKKLGLLGAKDAIECHNALSEYLEEQEIEFSPDYKCFTYQDTIYNIEEFELYKRITGNHSYCFLSLDDTGYFSEVLQVRPDIITLVSDIVQDSNLKDFWDMNHDTYIIKYQAPITAFDQDSLSESHQKDEILSELLIYAVNKIQFNGHVEISCWLKNNYTVKPEQIIYIHKYYNN